MDNELLDVKLVYAGFTFVKELYDKKFLFLNEIVCPSLHGVCLGN